MRWLRPMVSHERLFLKWPSALKPKSTGYKYMLILEYKLRSTQESRAAIDEAIRTTQFVRNKALRLWMDHKGVSHYDLHALCAQVAKDRSEERRVGKECRSRW